GNRIGYIGLGDAVDMTLAGRDWHQERRRQRISRILNELSQNTAACRVQNTDRTGRTNPLEDIRNDCPIAQAASEPMAVGMSLSLSGRLAIDDLKTGNAVPDFHHVIICTERNGQHARRSAWRWDGNDVGRGLSYSYTVQDAAPCAIDLIDPLTEPVAIVNRIESEVSPHIMGVVPHPARLPAVDLSLDSKGRRINYRDRSRLKRSIDVPLVGNPLKLRVDPYLAHTRCGRYYLS